MSVCLYVYILIYIFNTLKACQINRKNEMKSNIWLDSTGQTNPFPSVCPDIEKYLNYLDEFV